MLRLPRSVTVALLWLALALLPVRGWAAAWMVPVAAGEGSAAVAAAGAVPPCHAQADDGDRDGTAAPATCSMCDLCHSAAARAPELPVLEPALHDPLPAAAPAAPLPARRADGLYRPPRSLRA